MSLLSSIFPTNTGTPSNGTPPQPGLGALAPAPTPTPGTPGAQTPEQIVAAAAAASPTSALDKFNDMWHSATTSDGKPLPPTVDPLTQPIYNFDQNKLAASAAQMDFMSGVDPAKIQSALGGSAADLSAVINQAVQAAVIGITSQTGRLINDAVVTNNKRVTNALPTQIRKTQLTDSGSDHPVFSHPAVSPLVNALKLTEFQKNPNTPVAEIDAKIQSYVLGLAEAFRATSPEAVAAGAKTKSAEPDYSWVFNA